MVVGRGDLGLFEGLAVGTDPQCGLRLDGFLWRGEREKEDKER